MLPQVAGKVAALGRQKCNPVLSRAHRLETRDWRGAEDEKRQLDFFRHEEKKHGVRHPAASYHDLPEEVQMYISKIEIERYDGIQESLVGRCFLWSAVGAFVLLNHFGWISPNCWLGGWL